MIIKQKAIVELYRTKYGSDVILKHYPDGSAIVTSLYHCHGIGFHHGKYNTRHGAIIAIGKYYGKGNYKFVSQYTEEV